MHDVTVIGGGIIGVCSALTLQRQGYSVELLERGDIGRGSSYGNCGLLAPGEMVPISRPGVLRKIPGWLREPASPLFVRRGALVRELPWLIRFLWSGRRKRAVEIAGAVASLTARARGDYDALLAATPHAAMLSEAETILVFDSRAEYEGDGLTWALREQFGFRHQFLTREDLRALEPELGGPLTCGVLLRDWVHVADPYLLVTRLADIFVDKGGTVTRAAAEGIRTDGRRAVALRLAGGEERPVSRVVLAAGAWSGMLARDLGVRVPLAQLQGYHFHIREPNVNVSRAVIYANGGFALTPMETGLRIAGTIEVAGPDPQPDYRRANILAARAKAIMPRLDISEGDRWMGARPFTPDSLPVLGPSPHQDNVVLAFGHCQVGLTLGATTGRIVADLVAGRRPPVDLAPFRPDRFRFGSAAGPRPAQAA